MLDNFMIVKMFLIFFVFDLTFSGIICFMKEQICTFLSCDVVPEMYIGSNPQLSLEVM